MTASDQLLKDADLARMTAMSRSWIRKQRMLRRQGVEHALTVAAILIGTAPRYRLADIHAWINAQRKKGA
jgi:hypothetical protein